MSASGFHWEGFFRAMQGDITSTVFLITLTVTTFVILRVYFKATHLLNDSEKQTALKWSTIIALIAIGLIVIALGIKIVMVASVNRIPRSDADKSGVYQQMDSASEHAE